MTDDTYALRSNRLNLFVGGGLVLVVFGLYASTLAPSVLEADAGEFQFVAWLPGIAHPTGYPLYVLLGWLWTHLIPFGQVAWRMNLLSAVVGAGAVGLTFVAARELVDVTLPEAPLFGRVVATLIGAATFAVTPTFWSQAIIAEVYTLHALFVAGLVWLALKWRQLQFDPRRWPGKWLALTFGLSLTHHRTILLLLPAFILFWWYAQKKDEQVADQGKSSGPAKWRAGWLPVIYGLLLMAPLLLYLYLPLIAPHTPYATLQLSEAQTLILYENSGWGFWDHVMGTVFTGGLRPTAAGLDRFVSTWQLLRLQVGWAGIATALIGLLTLWQRRQFELILLTGLGWIGIVAFNLIYFIGDIFVLFIPAWQIVTLWIALGVLGLSHGIARWYVRRKMGDQEEPILGRLGVKLVRGGYRVVAVGVGIVCLFLFVVLLVTRNTWIDQSDNRSSYRRWQEILAEPIPRDAILISNDRNEIMPMWYFQYVEGIRPDLLGLFPLVVTDAAYGDVGGVLDQSLRSGRPVYLIKPMPGLNLKANLAPAESLFKATPIENKAPATIYDQSLPELIVDQASDPPLTETIKLLGYSVSPTDLSPGDPVVVTLYWQPVQTLTLDYTSYVHLLTPDGRGLAQSDQRPGGDYYPSHLWQVNEVLRDRHTLELPQDLPPGEYQLRVGMYHQPEPGLIRGMGPGEIVGSLKVSSGRSHE